MTDWMKDAGLSWGQRMALKLGRGGIVDFAKKLFEGKPGLLRTVLAVYVVVVGVLHAFGLGSWAQYLTGFVSFIGITPETAGAPFSTEAVVAGIIAFIALVRPIVRWLLPAKDAPAK